MTPEQQAQYQEFLKAYPQLASKMDTSRQMNTPLVEAVKKGEVEGRPLPLNRDGSVNHAAIRDDDEMPDVDAIEAEQKAPRPFRDRPLGTMQISPQEETRSIERADEERDRRLKERMRRERDEEGYEEPPRPPKQKKGEFSPVGKRHPVLQRVRQSLGMGELEHSETITLHGINYALRRLTREGIAKAVSLATYKVEDESMLRSYIETAIIAHATATIDGVELTEVFDVPLREYSSAKGREDVLSMEQRRSRAAREMFDLLIDGPSELTDALVVFYEQHFPAMNFLPEGTSLALCPASGCAYKAIVPVSEDRYCPIHGDKLHKEEALPNPSTATR
jgi:hypothetical protein